MALFMLANNLTPTDVLDPKREIGVPGIGGRVLRRQARPAARRFPEGIAEHGSCAAASRSTERPGQSLPPADFAGGQSELEPKCWAANRPIATCCSHLLYPKVFADFVAHQAKYSDVSVLPTPVFFYGMEKGEEVSVDIEPGKTLIIKFLTVGDPHPDGRRLVFFELNGQPREVLVLDRSLTAVAPARAKAEAGNTKHVAAPMPGSVVSVVVAAGEQVAAGQKLCTLEAMKMETTLYTEVAGKVAEVAIRPGTQVEGGDLLIRIE